MRRNSFSGRRSVVVLAALTAVVVVAALRGPAGGAGFWSHRIRLDGPAAQRRARNDGQSTIHVEPPSIWWIAALRGTVGSCQGASTLERTTDGASRGSR